MVRSCCPCRNGLDGSDAGSAAGCSTACSTPASFRCSSGSPSCRPIGCCSGHARRSGTRQSGGSSGCALALGIDHDVEPFYERFRFDPLIGRSVRANPGLRVAAKPDPFEALAWAICEQLIEFERAAAIQRRLIARLGRRCG